MFHRVFDGGDILFTARHNKGPHATRKRRLQRSAVIGTGVFGGLTTSRQYQLPGDFRTLKGTSIVTLTIEQEGDIVYATVTEWWGDSEILGDGFGMGGLRVRYQSSIVFTEGSYSEYQDGRPIRAVLTEEGKAAAKEAWSRAMLQVGDFNEQDRPSNERATVTEIPSNWNIELVGTAQRMILRYPDPMAFSVISVRYEE